MPRSGPGSWRRDKVRNCLRLDPSSSTSSCARIHLLGEAALLDGGTTVLLLLPAIWPFHVGRPAEIEGDAGADQEGNMEKIAIISMRKKKELRIKRNVG